MRLSSIRKQNVWRQACPSFCLLHEAPRKCLFLSPRTRSLIQRSWVVGLFQVGKQKHPKQGPATSTTNPQQLPLPRSPSSAPDQSRSPKQTTHLPKLGQCYLDRPSEVELPTGSLVHPTSVGRCPRSLAVRSFLIQAVPGEKNLRPITTHFGEESHVWNNLSWKCLSLVPSQTSFAPSINIDF